MAWYTSLPSDVVAAATKLANNHARFESFAWSTRCELESPADYAIVYLSNRDSDVLDRSNEGAILKAMASHMQSYTDGEAWEESHNHWAVGHVDGIVIRVYAPDGSITAAFRTLHAMAMRLQEYPILDETDFSEREQEEADRVWEQCYRPAERLEYIRRHRSQFDFHGFADLMGCVRGKYFAGYASELLGG